jgi:cell division protein FtsL
MSASQQIKITLIGIVLIAVFVGEFFVYAWIRVQCTHFGYEIAETRQEGKALLDLQKKLKLERAHLTSPERILKIATEQLGLVAHTPEQVVVIR